MNTRLDLGRIAGIPVYLDMLFVLLLVVFSQQYFTSGDTQAMAAGLLIVAGFIASILFHELGHAFAAWMFKTSVTEIVLTGLGGVARFGSSLPKSVIARVLIYIAGPLANFAIYYGCAALVPVAYLNDKPVAGQVLVELASINFTFMLFNLLPAYPLDGGHALDAICVRLFGGAWGQRIVAALGMVVSLLLVLLAIQSFPRSIFLLLLAFFLAELNWNMFQSAGGFRR